MNPNEHSEEIKPQAHIVEFRGGYVIKTASPDGKVDDVVKESLKDTLEEVNAFFIKQKQEADSTRKHVG
jgi:hypothetical protein